ncbi:MAG: CNNM domain-containing protein, partial [Candidatus Omnitrophota bacterium]
LSDEGIYFGTTLVGTNIAVVISSVLATTIFSHYFDSSFAPVVTTLVMVPVTLVFAEIVPKIISRQFAVEFALRAVTALDRFRRLVFPLILLVNTAAHFLLLPFKGRKETKDITFTKGDLKKILMFGHEIGEVEADEVELIHRVLDFGAKKVGSIMIPLYRVSSIEVNDTADNLKRLVTLTGFSRVPVYKENKKNIIGIINVYDILFETSEAPETVFLKCFIRDPVYVNRSDGLDIALTRLRHKKQPMGIVTGADGQVVGIITIEDILEEIVGEIEEDTGKEI